MRLGATVKDGLKRLETRKRKAERRRSELVFLLVGWESTTCPCFTASFVVRLATVLVFLFVKSKPKEGEAISHCPGGVGVNHLCDIPCGFLVTVAFFLV
jgi:hypothetical protein